VTDYFPLAGIRVLALENNWAGPWCSKIFGDLGAEVIRIEAIQRYDPARGPIGREEGRQYAKPGDASPPTERADTFLKANRNKLDLTLNLKDLLGKAVFVRLAAVSDVVVDNYSAHTLDELGLGYPTLREVNPGIVVCSMPLNGAIGRESNVRGYGGTGEVLSGMTSMTGYEGEGSIMSNFAIGDPVAGVHAATAIMLALIHRADTGTGQSIDLSQVETVAGFAADGLMEYILRGENPARRGSSDPRYAPHGVYRCAGDDVWIAVAVETDEEWQALTAILADPELSSNFLANAAGRLENRDRVDAALERWTAERTPREATEILQSAGIPAGPAFKNFELFDDPHITAREFFETVTHPIAGTHRYPGAAWKMTGTSLRTRTPAPLLGEHNDYVLRDLLGLTDAEVDTLADRQVIGRVPIVDAWPK
jgi:crotonobetainyl-CoA:carnitine CoA-transferase CaiB-like acyl-CoA transferase